jgi:hypothetical protein
MCVPGDSFLNKPKLVARFEQQKILSQNAVVFEGPFVHLSNRLSKRNASPYHYTVYVTRNIKDSGVCQIRDIDYNMLCYVHFVTKHNICGVNGYEYPSCFNF